MILNDLNKLIVIMLLDTHIFIYPLQNSSKRASLWL